MVDADNFHSKLVGLSKIILPMMALGLLSVLFMFARDAGPPPEIPFSEIEAMARDQRISAPRFSGVTDDGATIAISARSAKPNINKPDTVAVSGVALRMNNPDGSSIEVTATNGEVDGRGQIARFSGLTRLETSTGYVMETGGLVAELSTGVVTSDGMLEVHAPFGELTAGQVTLRVTADKTSQHMLFTQGVRLIYQPQD